MAGRKTNIARQATFTNCLPGVIEEADALARLGNVEVALWIESPAGQPYVYKSPGFNTVSRICKDQAILNRLTQELAEEKERTKVMVLLYTILSIFSKHFFSVLQNLGSAEEGKRAVWKRGQRDCKSKLGGVTCLQEKAGNSPRYYKECFYVDRGFAVSIGALRKLKNNYGMLSVCCSSRK